MASRESEVTENTRIPVSLVAALGALVFWVGVAWAQIADLKEKMTVVQSIDNRLSRIEGKLGLH